MGRSFVKMRIRKAIKKRANRAPNKPAALGLGFAGAIRTVGIPTREPLPIVGLNQTAG
jgi:hypothetical protein